MEIVKIGILGVAGVMLALQFKSGRPEYGLYLGARKIFKRKRKLYGIFV